MIIRVSDIFLRRKWALYLLLCPVFLYALFTSINNIFGLDLTGGWMGSRDPVGAGYVVILGSPFYFAGVINGLRETFVSAPKYLLVTPETIEVHQRPKAQIRREKISSVAINNQGERRILEIRLQNEPPQEIRLDFLDCSEHQLLRMLEDSGYPILDRTLSEPLAAQEEKRI
ncbi:MAG: hypothetical protein QNI84_00625 [Henriciella sp.]|nr:hypothetical protein [Henriciella sp.]